MTCIRGIAGVLMTTLLACGDAGAGRDEASSSGGTSSGAAPTTAVSATTAGDESGTSSTPGTGGDASTTTSTTTTTTTTTTTLPGDDTTGAGDDTTGSSSTGGPQGSRCAGSAFALCTDFEDAIDGGFPAGWGARGDEWGEGVIGAASDDARLGSRSLKVDGGDNGQHFMDFKGELGALATHHYGRVFMKVAVPAPWPADGVLHADFIEGLGPGPNNSNHNVRWGVVENTSMKMQWIFNIQPSNGDPEFGEGTGYDHAWTGEWQCIEWFYDQPAQQGTLWIDGVMLPIVPGTNHAAEIPVFSSLGVGLANYQPAGAGFSVWFDELAYDAARIGCEL